MCEQRIKDVETAAQGVKEVDLADGWVETNEEKKELEEDEVYDLDDEDKVNVVPEDDNEEEEIVDLDDLENDNANDNIFASD